MAANSVLTLTGSLVAVPQNMNPGDPPIPIPILEVVGLSKKHYDEVSLTDNNPLAVSFGGLSEVNVLCMRAEGGKVRLRVTSADGAVQSIPLDPLGILLSLSVPITALDLTRAATVGNTVTVKIFLAQKA